MDEGRAAEVGNWGFYGYRGGYYGPRGKGLTGVLAIVLIIWLVMGGGFELAMCIRWPYAAWVLESIGYRSRPRSAYPNEPRDFSNQYDVDTGISSGTSDKIKGRVEEAVGIFTDDRRLKDEGKLGQATRKMKKAVERVIDKAKG